MFHQSLCAFDHHLGHTFMMLRQLVKCGVYHFHIGTFNRLLKIRHLFRPLIDQQDDKMHVRACLLQRSRHFLQQCCFTCLRRRNDHTTLAFSHRADQIHDTHRHRRTGRLKAQALVRKDRRHIFEICPALGDLRRETVDLPDIQ